jgi:hypothetical protein
LKQVDGCFWEGADDIGANTDITAYRMGAYKYIGELYKKKQSDVLRFLLRVRYVVLPVAFGRFLTVDMEQLLGIPPAKCHSPGFAPVTP